MNIERSDGFTEELPSNGFHVVDAEAEVRESLIEEKLTRRLVAKAQVLTGRELKRQSVPHRRPVPIVRYRGRVQVTEK